MLGESSVDAYIIGNVVMLQGHQVQVLGWTDAELSHENRVALVAKGLLIRASQVEVEGKGIIAKL